MLTLNISGGTYLITQRNSRVLMVCSWSDPGCSRFINLLDHRRRISPSSVFAYFCLQSLGLFLCWLLSSNTTSGNRNTL
ncbi:hypothetical protein BDV33DRAFT_168151 [Aspergillus novoparasiticus]|uniref:Uncharacterized protein n=1 Tax=Aspergillus novoparasiticus TaxID=986946 RepID=A0A5N6F2C9_9EURO|nr:hypothetical protein BDV33DRAFT_168151 [Aspergillus novoparasiticus]